MSYDRTACVLPVLGLSERGCSSGVGQWGGKLITFHTMLSVGHNSARGSGTTPVWQSLGFWIGGYRLLCASKSVALLSMCLMEFGVTFDSVSLV